MKKTIVIAFICIGIFPFIFSKTTQEKQNAADKNNKVRSYMKKIILSFVIIVGVFCFATMPAYCVYNPGGGLPSDTSSYEDGYNQGYDDATNGRPDKYGNLRYAMQMYDLNIWRGYWAGYDDGKAGYASGSPSAPASTTSTATSTSTVTSAAASVAITDYQTGLTDGTSDYSSGSADKIAKILAGLSGKTSSSTTTIPWSIFYIKGYEDGFAKGRATNGAKSTGDATQDGYQIGFADGLSNAGYNTPTATENQQGYHDGYFDGISVMQDYVRGLAQGLADKNAGKSSSLSLYSGESLFFIKGYNDGYNGPTSSITTSADFQSGYALGLADGFANAAPTIDPTNSSLSDDYFKGYCAGYKEGQINLAMGLTSNSATKTADQLVFEQGYKDCINGIFLDPSKSNFYQAGFNTALQVRKDITIGFNQAIYDSQHRGMSYYKLGDTAYGYPVTNAYRISFIQGYRETSYEISDITRGQKDGCNDASNRLPMRDFSQYTESYRRGYVQAYNTALLTDPPPMPL